MKFSTVGFPEQWTAAIWGALIGDALGVPHEFKAGADVCARAAIAMQLPAAYPKTYPGIPYGTWSDDGSQLLCLLDSIQRQRCFDAEHFAATLLRWLDDAYLQAGGAVFDCGMQTRQALEKIRSGERTWLSPPTPAFACGNGSLMRVLPIAMLPMLGYGSERDALEGARTQARVTHPQAIAGVVCALIVELYWQLGRTTEKRDWTALLQSAAICLRQREILDSLELQALDRALAHGQKHLPNGGGHILDTLWSALWAVSKADSCSDVLRWAISLGGDADTVACIAGGLAGFAYGLDGTCNSWKGQLSVPAEAASLSIDA